MKRIVLSGAGGFLGSHIVAHAQREGIPVLAITTRTDVVASDTVQVISTECFLNGEQTLSSQDVFVNCMFPTNADGRRMADGLQKVYEMIRTAGRCGAGSMINISSQSVYPSERKTAASETDLLSLETPYAVGKYSTEVFCDEVFQNRPHTGIRLASLLGIGYEQRIVNRMVSKALNGETLQVVGGMQRYGFLDVRDAAAGIVCMSQTDATAWRAVYNLGAEGSCTLLEAAQLIVRLLQEKGYDAAYQVTDGTDERNSALCAELFMNDFSWKPALTLEQTVRDIIAHKLQDTEK